MFEQSGTIANLGCSILAHYGLTPPNGTLPAADKLLKQGARNVVVLLLDAMGTYNMRQLLAPDGFFFRNLRATYTSVFPPTTAAATTSLESGLFPAQHGWLGWTMYYPQIDKNVEVFTNLGDDRKPAAAFAASHRFMPYATIQEQLRAAGHQAYTLAPWEEEPTDGIQAIAQRLQTLCAQPGNKYIYAYCNQPDKDMHVLGVNHPKVRDTLRAIEQTVQALSASLLDTLLLITADHGHIDIQGAVVADYPDIMDCLVRLPSIEPRCLNLFVKTGRQADFMRAFHAAFGEDFQLFTRQEALDSRLFGPPPLAKGLGETIGDYVAVARTPRTLFNSHNQLAVLKGAHAGGMDAERDIPLIAPPINR